MAWYAELKRRKWWCINGINIINIYKQKLYDDWYNSLTDNEKQRLEEYRKDKKEKDRQDTEKALAKLCWLYSFMNRATGGRIDNYKDLLRQL